MNLSLQLLEISHVVVLRRAEWAWCEVFAAWREVSIHVQEQESSAFYSDNGLEDVTV